MSQTTISAPATDVIEATQCTAEALALVKTANERITALETENANLRAKLAKQDEVVLEKVAAAKREVPAVSDEAIKAASEALVASGYLKPTLVTKFAADCKASPDFALSALAAYAQLSETPKPSGFGMPKKTASALLGAQPSGEQPEDWGVIAREGA